MFTVSDWSCCRAGMEPVATSYSSSFVRFVKYAVYGAVCARITLFIIRKFREDNAPKSVDKWSFSEVANHVENAKEAAKLAQEEIRDKLAVQGDHLEEELKELKEDVGVALTDFTEEMKQKLLGDEIREAFATIQHLIENVKQSIMLGAQYQSSLLLLLAMVRKVQEEDCLPAWERSLPPASLLSPEEAVSLSRISQFALSTYSATWSQGEEEIARQMGVEPEDVVFTWCRDEKDTGLCPKFIVLLDHESESIVLAVRGTFCLKDVILDMVCDDAPFLGGFAHKGIREGAVKVWSLASPAVLSAVELYPSYTLALTGHSLGAGVAVLLALELLLGESACQLPPSTVVCCTALAPPPVYRAASSWLQTASLPPIVAQRVQVVVHRHDCIPRMCLGSLAGLVASLRAVDSLELSLGEMVEALSSTGGEVRARVVAALKDVRQDTFPFLQHPGTILYLEPGEGEEYLAIPQSSERLTGQLLLVPKMVADHRKESYEKAIGRLTRAVLLRNS